MLTLAFWFPGDFAGGYRVGALGLDQREARLDAPLDERADHLQLLLTRVAV